MGGLSVWHWLIALIYLGLTVFYFSPLVRILNRLGFSGWWSLLTFIPIGNIVALFIFSMVKWPRFDRITEAFE
ncbi:MAG: hypothetical protein JOY76_08780 [Hyphomicrobiales bacterium]|nr:hypothetical protein [Hyphomicrobiales bacterium]